jgi:hypothetical protein
MPDYVVLIFIPSSPVKIHGMSISILSTLRRTLCVNLNTRPRSIMPTMSYTATKSNDEERERRDNEWIEQYLRGWSK